MMRSSFSSALALAAAALGGCATPSAAQHAVPAFAGPASRAIDLPVEPGPGDPREVRVLVDEPGLRVVSIVLRAGTVLPPHHAAVPVTIQALAGRGVVVAGEDRLVLDATHAVVLAPHIPHAVEPEPGTDLVLLVHHHGRAEEHHP